MKILIDTHILIGREFNRGVQGRLREVLRLINDLNYQLVVHPSSIAEIKNDKNIPDKGTLLSKIETYPVINPQSSPKDDDTYYDKVGKPGSEREKIDLDMLYCVYKKEVDLFLTEDSEIIRKAMSLDISDKVIMLKVAYKLFSRELSKKSKVSDILELHFYKKGFLWHIGEKGNICTFHQMKGFEYIHLLLSQERKLIHSILISNPKGDINESDNDKGNDKDKDKHRDVSSDQIKDFIINTIGDDKNRANIQPNKFTDEKEFKKLSYDELQSALDEYAESVLTNTSLSPDQIDSEKKRIIKIREMITKESLKDNDKLSPEAKRARTGVTKAITRALNLIRTNKSSSSLAKYLNKSTIHTGFSCMYAPEPHNKLKWVLNNPDE